MIFIRSPSFFSHYYSNRHDATCDGPKKSDKGEILMENPDFFRFFIKTRTFLGQDFCTPNTVPGYKVSETVTMCDTMKNKVLVD